MKVTLTAQNRAIEKEKKTLFAAHIKGLKIKDKQNICNSDKLKFQFDNFDPSQIVDEPCIKQKRNMKNFQFLKQKCKASNPTKVYQSGSYRGNKQFSTQSQVNKNINASNNPQLYEDRIMTSLNQLKSTKQDLSHSTKANSREKSRATSCDSSSTICCNFIKPARQQVVVITQNKEIVPPLIKDQKRENKKISKISKIKSPQISKTTRIVILDWMFQLSAEIQLPKQALYNSIDYIDKFVLQSEVKKSNYQQVGLACLFLATKLQMSSHPRIQTFLQAIDNKLDRQVLIETQRKIVNTLKFRLNPPTLYQYMTVAVLTIKTFKSQYKNIGWVNDLPSVQKGTQLYRKMNWIMDGVTIEGALTHKYGKDQLCLAILYISMLLQVTHSKSDKQNIQEKQKLLSSIKHQSTAYSQISFNSVQKSFESVEQKIQKFNVVFECFLRYATTSNKSVKDLDYCLEDLKKWRISTCDCDDEDSEYHQELQHLALSK